MANDLITKHGKQIFDLKVERNKAWKELGKRQEKELIKNTNMVGMAERFAQEREEHNKQFEKAKSDLILKQQKELEEYKKLKGKDKSSGEIEM